METWRRDDGEIVTVEDRAAKIIAGAFGYGDSWPAFDVPTFGPREFDADGERLASQSEALRVHNQSATLEQASQALPADQTEWSEQLRELAAEKRAELAEWSRTHPLQETRGQIGEFENWRKCTLVAMPHAARFANAALALSRKISRLTRIECDMLRTYALEDAHAAETVLRHAVVAGHRRDIALNALIFRILFPHARRLHHSARERARELHMRVTDYCDAEYAATNFLRDLLRSASVKFLDAFILDEPRKMFPQHPSMYLEPENTCQRLK